jgi:hypothetical protein
MWETKRFKCKGNMSISTNRSGGFIEKFIEGKWYDGSYKIWSEDPTRNKKLYDNNGGWDEYAAISETGENRFFTRSHFKIVFFSDVELRNEIIDEIISDKTSGLE